MASTFLHCKTTASISSITRLNLHGSSSLNIPMKVNMPQNQSFWATVNADIEAHLERAIPIHPQLSVAEPMHQVIFSTPKSMASALCIAACEVVGGERDKAIAAASAVHMMHVAEFTLDDNQLSAQQKRKSMVQDIGIARFGVLPLGYELLATSDNPMGNNSEKILRAIIEITQAMGPQGMVDGQYWKMQCKGSYGDELCHIGWIDHVCEKMDGGLCSCGAACGAILGGGSEDEIKKLRRFGMYIGMIHGMMKRGIDLGRVENEVLEMVEGLKTLALKELEYFKNKDVDALKSLVDARVSQF
ncbi:hypothetical protein GIB67_011543 [Kingdonia uniflora]|uniref:Uncharacterized protein n=1 Tax=Kingdonia uniflora TaxID=39325 RepID=A0A7J7NMJ0_9MAGN|nr:hypothetical protein GIB67_011543 [Kingdonia uniflora]